MFVADRGGTFGISMWLVVEQLRGRDELSGYGMVSLGGHRLSAVLDRVLLLWRQRSLGTSCQI